jgi:hypothetical protein
MQGEPDEKKAPPAYNHWYSGSMLELLGQQFHVPAIVHDCNHDLCLSPILCPRWPVHDCAGTTTKGTWIVEIGIF